MIVNADSGNGSFKYHITSPPDASSSIQLSNANKNNILVVVSSMLAKKAYADDDLLLHRLSATTSR